MPNFSLEKIRADFPVLQRQVHGRDLIYLDNAATSLKPFPVIKKITDYYTHGTANIHRAVHTLSEEATSAFEETREKVAQFINAPASTNIVFSSGTTAAINLIALRFVRPSLKAGDEVLISEMEHHANIVPWQIICEEAGAILKVAHVQDDGELDLTDLKNKISAKTKFLSVVHVSNALGTINPISEICKLAQEKNIPILIDGAQAVLHEKIDVQKLGCDFYVFSAHKMLGPTGVGLLYGKAAHLEHMPPLFGGGDMIKHVSFKKTTFADAPARFEAGTPDIASVIGLGAGIEYLYSVGLNNIAEYEHELTQYAFAALSKVPKIKILGAAKKRIPVFTFELEDVHAHDLGTLLDRRGIAVRTGHHCTQPLMERFKVEATTRASFSFYNLKSEVDFLIQGIENARAILNA